MKKDKTKAKDKAVKPSKTSVKAEAKKVSVKKPEWYDGENAFLVNRMNGLCDENGNKL